MDRMIREELSRLQNILRSDSLNERIDNTYVISLYRWLRDSNRWIEDGCIHPFPWMHEEGTLNRLDRIEDMINGLLERSSRCNAPSDFKQLFPSFMTTLTAINDGNLAIGKKKFQEHQAGWLANANRCVIADPFIFKAGVESVDQYAKGLSTIVGVQARRVDFYFCLDKSSYKKEVAIEVFNELQKSYQGLPRTKREIVFYPYSDLHDRVWLHHLSIADDPSHTDWSARVVGASVNGVRSRPTYIVDMNDDDANDYSKYLRNIRNIIPAANVTRAPPTLPTKSDAV